MPPLGTIPLAKALSITVQDRFLVVTSDVGATPTMMAADIPELPGFSSISVLVPNNDGPASLSFRHQQMDIPGQLVSQIEVIVNANDTLQIAHGIEWPLATLNVTLLQERNHLASGSRDEPVRLIIQKDSEYTGRIIDMQLGAPDFQTLCTRYPSEVSQFVRPMLRQIHLENAVFKPTEATAWQVLQPTSGASDTLKQEVVRLLEEARNPNFARRQAAINQLRSLGQAGADALGGVPRAGLSPQQVHVLETVMDQRRPLATAEAEQLLRDPQFLLDCLSLNDPVLRDTALQRLTKLVAPRQLGALPETQPERDVAINRLRISLSADIAATQPAAQRSNPGR